MKIFDDLKVLFTDVEAAVGIGSSPAAPAPATPAPLSGLFTALPKALKLLSPTLSDADVQTWSTAFAAPMQKAQISTAQRCAAFLGEMCVESGSFKATSENLTYSAERLVQVWPSRFPSVEAATPFAHNPQALANKVYNGRMGNAEGSNDGWTFRGGGPMQLTGRSTYDAFGKSVNMTAEQAADYTRTPTGGAASAVWYWSTHNLNPLADKWDLTGITQAINGGQTGAAQRVADIRKALGALQDA